MSRIRRLLFVVIGCLQSIVASGILYGWSSVEGAGSFLTSSVKDRGAGLSTQETTSIFARAVSIAMMSCLVLGFVHDKLGPRACSVVSHIIIITGVHLMVGEDSSASRVGTAMCFISFGGPGIQLAVIHLSNLFPSAMNLTMGVLTGSISLSFAILPIIETLWEQYDIHYQVLFHTLQCLLLLSVLISLWLWPDKPFDATTVTLDGEESTDSADSSREAKNMDVLLETGVDVEEEEEVSRLFLPVTPDDVEPFKSLPLYRQLASGVYARMLLIFLATSFTANLVVAALPLELDNANVSQTVAKSFSFMNALGIFASIVAGYTIDKFGLVKSTLLALALGIVYHALTIWMFHGVSSSSATHEKSSFASTTPQQQHPSWFWMMQAQTSFLTYVLFRQFLYPVFISSVSTRCGYKNFGMLVGIGFALSGVLQLFGIAGMIAFGSRNSEHEDGSETEHRWILLHGMQILIFAALLVIPFLDAAHDYGRRDMTDCSSQRQLSGDDDEWRRRRQHTYYLKQDSTPTAEESSSYGSTSESDCI